MDARACLVLVFAAVRCAAQGPPRYSIETVAGSSNLGDGGPATAAQFGAIKGIAADAWGNLYIADTDHHRVRKVEANGVVTTVAGTGTAGFSGDGGPASAAQLNLPYGLAADLAGNLYIADLGNNRVRRMAADGTISTVAGGGPSGSGGDGGPATAAGLVAPRNVAVDALGNLYIAEFGGHRVRRVAANGVIATVAGTGVAGFNGDGGAAATQIHSPAGLAFDRTGALLIADSGNARLRRLTGTGLATIGGPWPGSTPVGVAADPAGNIYLADTAPILDSLAAAAGSQWIRAAGTGASGFSGDGGPAVQAVLSAVWDVAADLAGNVYLADGVRVRRIDRSGIIQTVAGDGYRTAVGDGLAATQALLYQPAATALDAAGNLYIADAGTNRVRQVAPGGVIRTFAGNGELDFPMSVAQGAAGAVWIADTGSHRILVANAGGVISTVAGTGTAGSGAAGQPATGTDLRAPRGVCTDRAGALYIVDTGNHRVLRVGAGGIVQVAAGTGAAGNSGDGGPATLAQLNQPTACALDTAGDLFIADTGNHQIRRVTPGGSIRTVAGSGQSGFSGDEGPATAAQLNAPAGIAVEDDGNLFLADSGNHRIRQVTPDGVIHTIAGTGVPGYSGDGAAAGAQLDNPTGLVLDGAGDLYFADTGNNRVRRLAPQAALPPPAPITAPPATPPAIFAFNAASFAPGPAAPGEILVLTGTGLGPQTGVAGTPDASGLLPTEIAGAAVTFDGIPAPVLYAQYEQINVQAPYAIAGNRKTHIAVSYNGQPAGALDLAVAPANPALFPVIVNQDGSENGPTSPAPHGTAVAFFATGEGLTSGANVSGLAAQPPYAQPQQPVSLSIGGIPCELLFAAEAPNLTGELQINARVPGAFLPGGAAKAVLTVGGFSSPPVTVWVQ